MEVFNTQPERGNTLFVDLTKLYLNLSLDEQDFLRQCTIIHPQHLIDDSDYLAIKDKIQKDITSSVIKEHWFTKEPVLRLSF
jgi:alpha-ketoglutarate-dependent taurine dioxygenase